MSWPHPFRAFWTALVTGTLLAAEAVPVPTLPQQLLQSWRWTRFGASSGLPASATKILEDPSGTIWVGTRHGLYFFDGFGFQRVPPESGLPANQAVSGLWSWGEGLALLQEGVLYLNDMQTFRPVSRHLGRISTAASFGSDGLLVSAPLGLYHFRNQQFQPFSRPPKPSVRLDPIIWDGAQEKPYVNTGSGLYRWDGEKWSAILSAPPGEALVVSQLNENDQDGLMTVKGPTSLRGVWSWRTGQPPHREPALANDTVRATAQLPGRENLVVMDSGVVRTERSGRWQLVPGIQPLDGANTMTVDSRGRLWIGAAHGISIFETRSGMWEQQAFPAPDLRNMVHALLAARDGSLWTGSAECLEVVWPDGRRQSFRHINGQRISIITGLAEDPEGGIWVVSGSGFKGAYRWNGQFWRHFGVRDGLPDVPFHRVTTDRRGRIWLTDTWSRRLGHPELGGAYSWEKGAFTHWGLNRFPEGAAIYQVLEAADGALWFATTRGLVRYRDGRVNTWSEQHGMPVPRVFAIHEDAAGRIWYTNAHHAGGLGFFDPSKETLTNFSERDGLPSREVMEITSDPAGRIWAATASGLAVFHRGHWLNLQSISPMGDVRLWPLLVHNNQLLIGSLGKGLYRLNLAFASDPRPAVTIHPTQATDTTYQFQWSVRDYWARIAPNEIESRFRLDGSPWSPWSTARSHTVPQLAAGTHLFEVQARGLFADFTEPGAQLAFAVAPPYWQRPGFVVPLSLLAIALLTVIAIALHRRRLYTLDLVAAVEKAEAGARAKSEFLAMMSHEIRTPMNGVIGMTELLLGTPLTPQQQGFATTIQASADSLLTIINDVLDFSKIEAGKLQIESVPFDLQQLVDQTLAILMPRATAKGIRLEAHFQIPGRWHLGDPSRVRQILLNLAGNAVKFTAQGGVVVTLESPTPARIRCTVQDSGIGIPIEQQGRLFEQFSQADASSTRRFGGTGLGLAISRKLAEHMGGTIGFTSQPGLGSTFWFELPLAPVPAPEPAPPVSPAVETSVAATTPPAEPHGAPTGLPFPALPTRRRVLLAEDNRVNQQVALAILEHFDCEVEVAPDGRQALDLATTGRFDVILMDCQMPEMDGWEATRRIRAHEAAAQAPRTPVIALTANAMAADRESCLAAGMDDYLAKPLRSSQLGAALDRWAPPRPARAPAPETAPVTAPNTTPVA